MLCLPLMLWLILRLPFLPRLLMFFCCYGNENAPKMFCSTDISYLHYYARNNITYMYPVQVYPLRANTVWCYLKQDTEKYFNLHPWYSLVTPNAVLGVTVLSEKKGTDVRIRDSLKMSITVSHLIIMIHVQFLSTLLHEALYIFYQ